MGVSQQGKGVSFPGLQATEGGIVSQMQACSSVLADAGHRCPGHPAQGSVGTLVIGGQCGTTCPALRSPLCPTSVPPRRLAGPPWASPGPVLLHLVSRTAPPEAVKMELPSPEPPAPPCSCHQDQLLHRALVIPPHSSPLGGSTPTEQQVTPRMLRPTWGAFTHAAPSACTRLTPVEPGVQREALAEPPGAPSCSVCAAPGPALVAGPPAPELLGVCGWGSAAPGRGPVGF